MTFIVPLHCIFVCMHYKSYASVSAPRKNECACIKFSEQKGLWYLSLNMSVVRPKGTGLHHAWDKRSLTIRAQTLIMDVADGWSRKSVCHPQQILMWVQHSESPERTCTVRNKSSSVAVIVEKCQVFRPAAEPRAGPRSEKFTATTEGIVGFL